MTRALPALLFAAAALLAGCAPTPEEIAERERRVAIRAQASAEVSECAIEHWRCVAGAVLRAEAAAR